MSDETWAIIDKNKILSAGSEKTIKEYWESIKNGDQEIYDLIIERHEGNLFLVCIHDIYSGQ